MLMLKWESLEARVKKHLADKPDELARPAVWLSRKLGVRVQAVSNWGNRGTVPADQWLAIADALDCSLDELLGRKASPAWPLDDVTPERWHALSERHKGAAEAALVESIERLEAQSRKQA
jgi:hypothetical protein